MPPYFVWRECNVLSCGWLKMRGRDEERFGLEYDLDVYNIVAVSDFNMGGPPRPASTGNRH
jgi:hypothetical protein